MLSIHLAVPSCFNSFWHGVIPTSFFIFNDFYTCFTHFSQQCIGVGNDTVGKLHQPPEVYTEEDQRASFARSIVHRSRSKIMLFHAKIIVFYLAVGRLY